MKILKSPAKLVFDTLNPNTIETLDKRVNLTPLCLKVGNEREYLEGVFTTSHTIFNNFKESYFYIIED